MERRKIGRRQAELAKLFMHRHVDEPQGIFAQLLPFCCEVLPGAGTPQIVAVGAAAPQHGGRRDDPKLPPERHSMSWMDVPHSRLTRRCYYSPLDLS